MKKIEIYTKTTCPYCIKAKALFDKKGKSFIEYNIVGNDELRSEMIERADGATTVPQIFIDGFSIGGCDDLHDLDSAGELDDLL